MARRVPLSLEIEALRAQVARMNRAKARLDLNGQIRLDHLRSALARLESLAEAAPSAPVSCLRGDRE